MSSWPQHLILGSIGLCIAAVVAFLLLRAWRRQPLVSYRMVVLVLVATLVLPIGQLLAQKTGVMRALPFAGRFAAFDPLADQRADADAPVAEDERTLRVVASASVGDGARDAELALESEGDALLFELAVLESLVEEAESLRGLASSSEDSGVSSLAGALHSLRGAVTSRTFALGLALVYMSGLAFSLLRTGRRLHRTHGLLSHSEPVLDPEVLAVWERVLVGSPLRHRVQLRISPEIGVPMCFGLTSPTVLLPAADDPSVSPDVLSCVLLHELVHLERRDTWVMLGQEIARSVFWFHPVAWWLCRRIDVLRELSCDLLVVRRTGRRKRYASALVEYADWMRRGLMASAPASSSALLPWTSSNCQLARRIEMLVTLPSVRRGSRRATLFAATTSFAMLWGGQFALAAALSPAADEKQDSEDAVVAEILDELEAAQAEPARDVEAEREEWVEVLGHGAAVLEVAPGTLALVQSGGKAPNVLRLGGDDETPMLGVRVSPREKDGKSEILIEEVFADSLAETFGLEADDVILEINGNSATWEQLTKAKSKLRKGGMELEVLRDGNVVLIEIQGKAKAKKAKSGNRAFQWRKGPSSKGQALYELEDPKGNRELYWVQEGDGDDEAETIWVERDDDQGARAKRHWVFRDSDSGAHELRVEVDGDGNVHFGDEGENLYFGPDHDAHESKHKVKVKPKDMRHFEVHVDEGHGEGKVRVHRLHGDEGQNVFEIELDELHGDNPLNLGRVKGRFGSGEHGHEDHVENEEHAHDDEHGLEWILEHTPERYRVKVRGALEGLDSERPIVITRKMKERIHDALESSGEWLRDSKSRLHGDEGPKIFERFRREDSGDDHTNELKAEIERLREQMRRSQEELERVRRKLEQLRGGNEPKAEPKPQNDSRRFQWRRNDQASLLPTLEPLAVLPVEPAPEPSSAAWFPVLVEPAEAPAPSVQEPRGPLPLVRTAPPSMRPPEAPIHASPAH